MLSKLQRSFIARSAAEICVAACGERVLSWNRVGLAIATIMSVRLLDMPALDSATSCCAFTFVDTPNSLNQACATCSSTFFAMSSNAPASVGPPAAVRMACCANLDCTGTVVTVDPSAMMLPGVNATSDGRKRNTRAPAFSPTVLPCTCTQSPADEMAKTPLPLTVRFALHANSERVKMR